MYYKGSLYLPILLKLCIKLPANQRFELFRQENPKFLELESVNNYILINPFIVDVLHQTFLILMDNSKPNPNYRNPP